MSENADSKSRETFTQRLVEWTKGDRTALDEMLPQVYAELKRLAGYHLARERVGHTLQTTALVHEAFLRLVDQRHIDWKNRAQFLGMAAEMMRRILINHARKRDAVKRGAGAQRISLSEVERDFKQPNLDLIALDDALTELQKLDPRKGQLIELKFFGGMTGEEIAEVMQISTATVDREWKLARAWLYRAMARNR